MVYVLPHEDRTTKEMCQRTLGPLSGLTGQSPHGCIKYDHGEHWRQRHVNLSYALSTACHSKRSTGVSDTTPNGHHVQRDVQI